MQKQHALACAGAGVRICRTLGTAKLRNLDPFLMLDEMRMPASQATAGFPSHPHRGFETCSIMLSGKMEHRDSAGNHVSAQAIASPAKVSAACLIDKDARCEKRAAPSLHFCVNGLATFMPSFDIDFCARRA